MWQNLSPKTRRNISRILPFGIIWLASSLVFLVVEKAAVAGLSVAPSTGIAVNFEIFLFGSLAITLVGLLVGTLEVLYLDRLFARQSFTRKILYKTLLYLGILLIVTLLTYPIAASLELGVGLFDPQVWDKLFRYLISFTHLSTDLQLAVALVISLFYAEISENIGHGILINFFTGKYHRPLEEKRIFLFLDMKSSTTIAEQLGHVRYFELLKEYYDDLSNAVVEHSGEIYQYVGDEIVVSWTYPTGLRNHNCIRCFFAMKEALQKQADRYRRKYGLAPTFKAGIHGGEVTTGEIGAIKKEIIFTGDVLNATARIQALCNTYGVDLLISADLLKELDFGSAYETRPLGQIELRGKKEYLELFAILRS